MEAEDLIQQYRLLDVAYGNLEVSERIRNELLALKYEQLKARKTSFLDRSLVALLTLVAGLPVLYSLLPDEIGKLKVLSLVVFSVMTLLYWIVGLLQWWKSRDEEEELSSIINSWPAHLPEDDPVFLQTQISTFITRRNLAQEILAKNPPDPLGRRFKLVEEHWRQRLESALEQAKLLHNAQKMSDKRFQSIQAWLRSELQEDKP